MLRMMTLIGTLLVLAGAINPVIGVDYWPTDLNDNYDGSCTLGSCSLRDAVNSANLNPGNDTIHLFSGTYNLTRAGVLEDATELGDLDILDDVTIVGQGPDETTVNANNIDRVFHIADHVSQVHLRGMTIIGGRTSG